jgi:hypothetical protein
MPSAVSSPHGGFRPLLSPVAAQHRDGGVIQGNGAAAGQTLRRPDTGPAIDVDDLLGHRQGATFSTSWTHSGLTRVVNPAVRRPGAAARHGSLAWSRDIDEGAV